jgi:hypothetical protein
MVYTSLHEYMKIYTSEHAVYYNTGADYVDVMGLWHPLSDFRGH